MSNLVNFAKAELALALPADSNPGDPGYEVTEDGIPDVLNGYNDFTRKCMLELVEVFAKQGHSGFSASYTIEILYKLLNWQPLTPLTNNPSEWIEHDTDKLWQSKRNPKAFSEDAGQHYTLTHENFKILHTSEEYIEK